MLVAVGIVITLTLLLVALAARMASVPLFSALTCSFDSWADASRHGGELARDRVNTSQA